METVVANISGRVRRERLHGREHLVAPLSLIVPGVLSGSQGTLYYPPDELAKSHRKWNHIPIVVNHPERDGVHVSARDPDILNSHGVGVVLRAKADGKLAAEGWFDIEKCRKVEPRIVAALESGRPMELSTGLYTANEPAENGAAFNGTGYTHVARNHDPDHLAILPDSKGACDLIAGCGMNVNESVLDQIKRLLGMSAKADEPAANETPSEQPAPAGPNANATATDKGTATMTAEQKKAVVDSLITNCGCRAKGPWAESDRETLNAMPDDTLEKLKAQADAVKANEDARPKPEPTPAPPPAPQPVPVPAANVRQLTAEEWLKANNAPPQVQARFRQWDEYERQEKAAIVDRMTAILAAESRQSVTDLLLAKPIDELRTLATLAPPEPVFTPQPSYFGQAVPAVNKARKDPRNYLDMVPPTVPIGPSLVGKSA